MLQLEKVNKYFNQGKGKSLHAVKNVSFQIGKEQIVALIGESGSGKSTIADMIIGLEPMTSGQLIWDEKECEHHKAIVFQNPDRSLNPYFTVYDCIAEPLLLNKWRKQDIKLRVKTLLNMVGLTEDFVSRYPRHCSGGQKQRIAIARALSLSPRLLIADEITSALDPFTEREIMSLLKELCLKEQMSFLYITHRIETLTQFADQIVVLKDGSVVEYGNSEQVLFFPQYSYTKQLLTASTYRD